MYEHLKALLDAPETSSELKAEITEVLSKCDTIRNLTDNFVSIARQKNIPLNYNNEYGVDGDIFNWLPNATVSTNPFPKGSWNKVDTKNSTTEKVMLETAQIMSLSQAIQCFSQELTNGTFDKLDTYRIIFLEEKNDEGVALELVCGRLSDGELHLCVDRVSPDDAWDGTDSAWHVATNA